MSSREGYSSICPTGRRPKGADPGPTGEIISLSWPGNDLESPQSPQSPQKSWRRGPGSKEFLGISS